MIIDLHRFLAEEEPVWNELATYLDRLESDPGYQLDLEQVRRFHYLYQRASADLAQLTTFHSEPALRTHLESLVARAYGEIHETRHRPHRLAPWRWLFGTFPRTFRRHLQAFQWAVLATIVGALFGGAALALDPGAKQVLLPFAHLQTDPAERVAMEEEVAARDAAALAPFSTYLMTHNTRVSMLTMALGMTYGIGTILTLFYNGIILGAVSVDYVNAGCAKFLVGWLLPHGAFEIPAVLIAGQAGFVLAATLIGRGTRLSLATRLRRVGPDLVTLIGGVSLMLVWAGVVEAFFSQYHEPVLPYLVKITFGVVELVLLTLFLSRAGRDPKETP